MKKRKEIALILALFLTIQLFSPCVEAQSYLETEDLMVIENASEILISDENVNGITSNNAIPSEVRNRVAELMDSAPEGSTITLYVPGSEQEFLAAAANDSDPTYSTADYWSYYRTYNGYQMRDYIIKFDTAFGHKNILASETSINAAGFSQTIMAYCAGAVLDSFIPFGSAATTLIDFLLQGDADSVSARYGDKASAAPDYYTYEYYTYVTTAEGEILGATTYYSCLEEIAWSYYSQETDQTYQGITTYNKTFYSTNFKSRDSLAYKALTLSAQADANISIKIGYKTFNF